jgi:hypothetical protein
MISVVNIHVAVGDRCSGRVALKTTYTGAQMWREQHWFLIQTWNKTYPLEGSGINNNLAPQSDGAPEKSSFHHGFHVKSLFIETLSFRVQQFSVVLAHVDVSDGAQGILLEMDLSTMFSHENQKEKLSFDLSHLMMPKIS